MGDQKPCTIRRCIVDFSVMLRSAFKRHFALVERLYVVYDIVVVRLY
jgi:hypothetical protein